jgi:hypothetical protein
LCCGSFVKGEFNESPFPIDDRWVRLFIFPGRPLPSLLLDSDDILEMEDILLGAEGFLKFVIEADR